MKSKKIFVFLGHPDKETRSGSFADAYEKGAREAGHEVRRINLGELSFDPILHKGYKVIQDLEPDLVKVQEAFRWAEHVAIFHPIWFASMPALMKGMFERMWLPAFAYRFGKKRFSLWQKLMKGRSATIYPSMYAPPFIEKILYGDYTSTLKKGILGFAGFSVKVRPIGPMKMASERALARHRARMERFGRKAK
jgi:putative NADPH-quinone reductase